MIPESRRDGRWVSWLWVLRRHKILRECGILLGLILLKRTLVLKEKIRQPQKKGMPSSTEYKTIKATLVRIAAERFYVLLEDGRERGGYCFLYQLAHRTTISSTKTQEPPPAEGCQLNSFWVPFTPNLM